MSINKINKRIREVRTELELSQAKFATRMAISAGYLAELELNKKTATERVIRLLATEFNVDSHWLRTGEGSMFKTDMDAQLSKIISLFNTMNHQFKECALNQMEELAALHTAL